MSPVRIVIMSVAAFPLCTLKSKDMLAFYNEIHLKYYIDNLLQQWETSLRENDRVTCLTQARRSLGKIEQSFSHK